MPLCPMRQATSVNGLPLCSAKNVITSTEKYLNLQLELRVHAGEDEKHGVSLVFYATGAEILQFLSKFALQLLRQTCLKPTQ